MGLFSGVSVRWKIYSIAIVSIIGFGAYLGFNVWVNTKNTELLTSVRDAYFPILEKATANSVRLERISELFNTAVLTGELDYLRTAEASANIMRKDFDQIHILEPRRKADIESIRSNFDAYYTAAYAIATEMATGETDFSSLSKRVTQKENLLELLKVRLQAFQRYSHQNFTGNIGTANRNSEFMLTTGFVLWSISILVLAITVYTIAHIILKSIIAVSKSLHNIAKSGDIAQHVEVASNDEIGRLSKSFNELMDKLRERTNDLASMMQHMHQGLLTITEDGSIHKEYSAHIEKIFDTSTVAGEHYAHLLLTYADIGQDQRNQIETAVATLLGSDEMMFAFNQHLLLTEFTIQLPNDPDKKILEVDWDPITSDGTIHKIMVTVRDVTHLRAMQAEAEEQKRELNILGQIIRIQPSKFDAFIKNSRSLIADNKRLLQKATHKDLAVVSDLFVNMHTIKGNARTYALGDITNVVHEAETTYDRLRKEPDAPWDQQLLSTELEAVSCAIEEYAAIKADKLSASSASLDLPEGSLVLDKALYQAILNTCKHSSSDACRHIESLLNKANSLPAKNVLADVLASLPSLAEQLDKPAPNVVLDIDHLLIKQHCTELVQNCFTHLLRNAIDHGIEAPAARQVKGKTPEGNIHLSYRQGVLELADDGQGLNLARLKQKALAAGKIDQTQPLDALTIANTLFESGVSTAETVSAISGRGVGMDAVRKYLQDNHCDIQIALAEGASASDEFAPFSLRIRLAEAIYEETTERKLTQQHVS